METANSCHTKFSELSFEEGSKRCGVELSLYSEGLVVTSEKGVLSNPQLVKPICHFLTSLGHLFLQQIGHHFARSGRIVEGNQEARIYHIFQWNRAQRLAVQLEDLRLGAVDELARLFLGVPKEKRLDCACLHGGLQDSLNENVCFPCHRPFLLTCRKPRSEKNSQGGKKCLEEGRPNRPCVRLFAELPNYWDAKQLFAHVYSSLCWIHRMHARAAPLNEFHWMGLPS